MTRLVAKTSRCRSVMRTNHVRAGTVPRLGDRRGNSGRESGQGRASSRVRALTELESPNRRGWGPIGAFWRGSGFFSALRGVRVDALAVDDYGTRARRFRLAGTDGRYLFGPILSPRRAASSSVGADDLTPPNGERKHRTVVCHTAGAGYTPSLILLGNTSALPEADCSWHRSDGSAAGKARSKEEGRGRDSLYRISSDQLL